MSKVVWGFALTALSLDLHKRFCCTMLVGQMFNLSLQNLNIYPTSDYRFLALLFGLVVSLSGFSFICMARVSCFWNNIEVIAVATEDVGLGLIVFSGLFGSLSFLLTLCQDFSLPSFNYFNPSADIDLTVSTDFEDLLVFLSDILEFQKQAPNLWLDSIFGFLCLGGGLVLGKLCQRTAAKLKF